MMKSVMIAAAAITAMATMASAADRPTILGYSEYAVEAESFETGVGAEFIVADSVLITPMIIGSGDVNNFAFDHAELKAKYGVNENIDLYGKIASDADFNYAETTVGVAFQF
mgnify:CR=1 FL=1